MSKPIDSRKIEDLGALGKSLGLTWGGDFKSLVDRPHFQNDQDTSLKELREKYGTEAPGE